MKKLELSPQIKLCALSKIASKNKRLEKDSAYDLRIYVKGILVQGLFSVHLSAAQEKNVLEVAMEPPI